VAAVLLSRSTAARDPSERDNARVIAARHGVRVLGPVRFESDAHRRRRAFRAALAPLVALALHRSEGAEKDAKMGR
jgi:dethiobiotin synthetase